MPPPDDGDKLTRAGYPGWMSCETKLAAHVSFIVWFGPALSARRFAGAAEDLGRPLF
jgi:hypothetical protein